MRAAYASDVPRGAGLSSSASVELAFAISWMHLAGKSVPPMELARLCQRAENQYVGVNCGIMDQAASACAQAGPGDAPRLPHAWSIRTCRCLKTSSSSWRTPACATAWWAAPTTTGARPASARWSC